MQVAIFANKTNANLGGKIGVGVRSNSINFLFRETPSCQHHTRIQVAALQGSLGEANLPEEIWTEWIDIPKDKELAARWLTNLARKKSEDKFKPSLKLEVIGGMCLLVCHANIRITLYRDEKTQGEILADRSSIKIKGFLSGDSTLLGKAIYYEVCNINPDDILGNYMHTCNRSVRRHR